MDMKKLSFVVIFFLLFSFQMSGVSAQVSNSAFSIESGSLDFSVAEIDTINTENAKWTIASGGEVTFQKTDCITVSDLSGTNQGWKFKIGYTNFSNTTAIADPTVKDEQLYVYINVADWLSLKLCDDDTGLNELKAGGSSLTPADIEKGTEISSENYMIDSDVTGSNSFNLLQVVPGFGAGVYDFYLMYYITVADWLPTGTKIESTSVSGRFANDNPVIVNGQQKYQIFAGTYETTITYSISGNPEI